MIKLLSSQEVLFKVTVIIVPLIDLFIYFISLLTLFALLLLLLDALESVEVGFLSFNPATIVSYNVLVREFWNSFDLLHARVLEEGLLPIFSLVTVVELHVNLDFFESIVICIELMLHVINTPVCSLPKLWNHVEGLIESAALNKWPNLLWALRYLELSVGRRCIDRQQYLFFKMLEITSELVCRLLLAKRGLIHKLNHLDTRRATRSLSRI